MAATKLAVQVGLETDQPFLMCLPRHLRCRGAPGSRLQKFPNGILPAAQPDSRALMVQASRLQARRLHHNRLVSVIDSCPVLASGRPSRYVMSLQIAHRVEGTATRPVREFQFNDSDGRA